MKRKISMALVFALVAMLAAMTALAAGLTFSNNFDVKRAALDLLSEKYGITEEMLTVLHVEVGEPDENGAQTVTLTPVERQYAGRVGEYAVTVQGGKLTASWSHDGEEIGEGIESPVYGAQQLKLLCTNYSEVMQYLFDTAEDEEPAPAGTPEPPVSEEDIETDMAAQEKAWQESKAAAEAAAKLTLGECIALAQEALKDVYGLTDGQIAKMVLFEDSDGMRFSFKDGQPVASLCFRLWQAGEDGDHSGIDDFTEKDGHYWVDVNMDTGVVEDMLYDSMLAANG